MKCLGNAPCTDPRRARPAPMDWRMRQGELPMDVRIGIKCQVRPNTAACRNLIRLSVNIGTALIVRAYIGKKRMASSLAFAECTRQNVTAGEPGKPWIGQGQTVLPTSIEYNNMHAYCKVTRSLGPPFVARIMFRSGPTHRNRPKVHRCSICERWNFHRCCAR